ncbi:MAG TPA: hypothetical protein VGQ57_09855 [Polyangiaceae bacterium]|jgi:hypothetical protein|nr:hypothetical protein [Polyangiaceae bacterium]
MSINNLLSESGSNRVAMLVVALCVIGACKKNDGETAAGGYVQGQVGPTGGAGPVSAQGGAPAVTPMATAGAPATAPTVAPTATGTTLPPPPPGPTAQRLDATAAAAVLPILSGLLKDNVSPGAKPVGDATVGNFGQGQTLEFPVQLQPNKCYTVVAAGLPPVAEVNLQLELTTALPGLTPVLAVDSDRGPTAVVGKKTACYKWTLGVIPAPGKVVVQVASGSGLVAAQAFEK